MYKEYFGFSRLPFGKDLESDDLFFHEKFIEFQKKMEFLKKHGGIGLLWGDSGTGKSSAMRWFRDSLNPSLYKFIYIPNPPCSVSSLYRELSLSLDLTPEFKRVDAFRQIQGHIQKLSKEKKITPIFAFDELQMASFDVLESIRLFLNFEMDSKDHAILILAGQTEFRKRLRYAVYEPLIHRTTIQWKFSGIERNEIEKYVNQRLKLGGVKHPIFEDDTFLYMYQVTNGNLRLINHLAIHSLELAAELKRKTVSCEITEKIMERNSWNI